MERDDNQKAQAVGMPVNNAALIRRTQVPEFRIEALPGGFLVAHHDGDYNGGLGPEREVVPNVDCLMSFVQRWANAATKR